jgi:hypothetical protein
LRDCPDPNSWRLRNSTTRFHEVVNSRHAGFFQRRRHRHRRVGGREQRRDAVQVAEAVAAVLEAVFHHVADDVFADAGARIALLALDVALKLGYRGLPGGDSLARLLQRTGRKAARAADPPLAALEPADFSVLPVLRVLPLRTPQQNPDRQGGPTPCAAPNP